MTMLFYIAAFVSVVSAMMVVTRRNAVHALLFLVLTLFGISLVFWTLGAAFAAVLQLIIYAGAIMVLFVFVVMLLNPDAQKASASRSGGRDWVFGALLGGALLFGILRAVMTTGVELGPAAIAAKEVGSTLYGPYLLGVEITSLLLLGGLVAAYRLGRREAS